MLCVERGRLYARGGQETEEVDILCRPLQEAGAVPTVQLLMPACPLLLCLPLHRAIGGGHWGTGLSHTRTWSLVADARVSEPLGACCVEWVCTWADGDGHARVEWLQDSDLHLKAILARYYDGYYKTGHEMRLHVIQLWRASQHEACAGRPTRGSTFSAESQAVAGDAHAGELLTQRPRQSITNAAGQCSGRARRPRARQPHMARPTGL